MTQLIPDWFDVITSRHTWPPKSRSRISALTRPGWNLPAVGLSSARSAAIAFDTIRPLKCSNDAHGAVASTT